jgi:hypothetical protein
VLEELVFIQSSILKLWSTAQSNVPSSATLTAVAGDVVNRWALPMIPVEAVGHVVQVAFVVPYASA